MLPGLEPDAGAESQPRNPVLAMVRVDALNQETLRFWLMAPASITLLPILISASL